MMYSVGGRYIGYDAIFCVFAIDLWKKTLSRLLLLLLHLSLCALQSTLPVVTIVTSSFLSLVSFTS